MRSTSDSGGQFEVWRARVGFGTADRDPGGDSPDLEAFLDAVDYPLYVVTVRAPDAEMSGCLAGFVTQCSIDPPNFLVCLSKANHTLRVAEHASGMALHLLGDDQADVARLFGEETGDRVDKFASVDWRLGSTGAPLLVDTAVSMEGHVLTHFSVGDHEAFLMRGVRAVPGGHGGILTYRTAPPLHPGHPA
jgi:flavin reductase (DIM6/NTAB) family NADH-FMN oxidoreductase RutF